MMTRAYWIARSEVAETMVARLRDIIKNMPCDACRLRAALASTTPSAPKTSEGGIKPAPRVGLATSAVGGTDQALPPVTGRGSEEPGVSPSAPVAGRSASDDASLVESASLETAANVTREPGATEGGPGACAQHERFTLDVGACGDCERERRARAAVVAEIVAMMRENARRKDSCANGESNSTYRHALLGAASLLRGYANAIEAKWGGKS